MYLKLLKKHIRQGTLHLHLPDGSVHDFGSGAPEARWIIHDERAIRRVARYWEYELGQTYMEGGWDSGDTDLRILLGLLRSNFEIRIPYVWLIPVLAVIKRYNSITRSYQDIAHHYDTDETIFRMFLDKEMYYSCAFFRDPADSLEQAQQNKAGIIARKLLLEPGMSGASGNTNDNVIDLSG